MDSDPAPARLGRLGPAEAARWLAGRQARGAPPAQLLDVREPWERDVASIAPAGTELAVIPMGELVARLDELDASRAVLAICHHGMRSLQCAAFLARQGFAEVCNLDGGIDRWSQELDGSVPRY